MSTPLVVVHHDARAGRGGCSPTDHPYRRRAGRAPRRVGRIDRRRVGTATLAAVAVSPARPAVDWAHLDVWWGDERFLPTGDAERNETQARTALLDLSRSTPDRPFNARIRQPKRQRRSMPRRNTPPR